MYLILIGTHFECLMHFYVAAFLCRFRFYLECPEKHCHRNQNFKIDCCWMTEKKKKKTLTTPRMGNNMHTKKNWVMKDCLSVVIICRSKMDEWQFGDKIEKENKGFCGAKQYLCLLAICHTISRLKIISCHYIFFSYISNDFFASAVDSIT